MFKNCKSKIESIESQGVNNPLVKKVFIAINCSRYDHFKDFMSEFEMELQKEFMSDVQNNPLLEDLIGKLFIENKIIQEDMKIYREFLSEIKESIKKPIETCSREEIYNETLMIIKAHMKLKMFDLIRDITVLWNSAISDSEFCDKLRDQTLLYLANIKQTECKIIKKEIKNLDIMIERIDISVGNYDKIVEINIILDEIWGKTKDDYSKEYIEKEFKDEILRDINRIKPLIVQKISDILDNDGFKMEEKNKQTDEKCKDKNIKKIPASMIGSLPIAIPHSKKKIKHSDESDDKPPQYDAKDKIANIIKQKQDKQIKQNEQARQYDKKRQEQQKQRLKQYIHNIELECKNMIDFLRIDVHQK